MGDRPPELRGEQQARRTHPRDLPEAVPGRGIGYEFLGGDLNGQRRDVDPIATVTSPRGHEYRPRARGSDVVFVHEGPQDACPGCWSGTIEPSGVREVACERCDRVSNLKRCRACGRAMEPEVAARPSESTSLKRAFGGIDRAAPDPSVVTWRCSCEPHGDRYDRQAAICPRCGSQGRLREAFGRDSSWQCMTCDRNYAFALPHVDETPAAFALRELPLHER